MGRLTRVLVAGLTLAVSDGLWAGDDIGHDEARRLVEEGVIVALDELIAKAGEIRRGRLLEAELESDGSRLSYELELLDEEGRVWELHFDARSGELLEQELEE